MPVFYICDMSQAEDHSWLDLIMQRLLLVKTGFYQNTSLLIVSVCSQDTPEASDLLGKLSSNEHDVDVLITHSSLISISPIFSEFAFIGDHPWADIYSVFRWDPFHTSSAGYSCSLNGFASLMFKDDMQTTLWMTANNDLSRCFEAVRMLLLEAANQFFIR